MIKALKFAPASLLAPFAYIQLLWVSILGAAVFGDFPDAVTVFGMVMVVAGGLLIAVSPRQQTGSLNCGFQVERTRQISKRRLFLVAFHRPRMRRIEFVEHYLIQVA
jgi:hypothetical protein